MKKENLKNLGMLHKLTDAVLQREQAKVADFVKAEQEIQNKLDALKVSESSRRTSLNAGVDTAFWVDADSTWQQWVAVRKTQLNSELARIRYQRMNAQSSLGRAFGRHNVVGELETRVRSKKP